MAIKQQRCRLKQNMQGTMQGTVLNMQGTEGTVPTFVQVEFEECKYTGQMKYHTIKSYWWNQYIT